ncbi:TlpA family protein disulfide reductase [Vulgatibacter incomptus]|uniref:Cytochrome c-type biogenesis protein CcmG/DsbE, thiol:disulfide oxidoreductase n=1 Tax=Vulgatibacter incomptus TaxID=1391653 RepID=A0A0K1P9N0_9BACT|nr:redoxin family protein [Vulgatibacter incomptus]AKU89819.1 Cytochrome c-type biogenesis protein CcmG/DsbE, thiol:disulfide oxidoreductase [Vulgatibacter incomptus]
MNKKVLLAGLVIVAPILVLFAVSFGRDPHAVHSPLVGREAPPFALASVDDGSPISLESLRGQPVVLNFWATWCLPCQQEHGVLYQGSRIFGDKVRFVGVVYEDEKPKIEEFLNRFGSGYPALLDEGGKIAIAYGVTGVPETFFIDASGNVVSKYNGPLSPDLLRTHVRGILGGQP